MVNLASIDTSTPTPGPDATTPAESTGLGLSVPLAGVPLSRQAERLREVAALGYHGVWSGEGPGHDAFTPLALAAAWAPQLHLAAGAVPAFTRGPALLAQSVATLCEAAPGRVTIGLGASSRTIVEGWNSLSYERPLQRMRDTLRFLRAALAGERVTHAYDTFRVEGFRLGTALPDPLPTLLVAGLRPKMLTLGAEEADGVIVNWVGDEDLRTIAAVVGAGREIVARVKVVPTEDPEVLRRIGSRLVNAYLHVPGYRRQQEWLGRAGMLSETWDRWAAGDRRGATAAIPDELLDQLFVWGDHARIRERLGRYAECGATRTVLAFHGEDDGWDAVRALGAPSFREAR